MEVAGSNYRRYFCSFLVKSDIFKYETAQTVQSQNLIALYLLDTSLIHCYNWLGTELCFRLLYLFFEREASTVFLNFCHLLRIEKKSSLTVLALCTETIRFICTKLVYIYNVNVEKHLWLFHIYK